MCVNSKKAAVYELNFISKDEWLSSSPDLNPMDYSVWAILESKANAKAHKNLESLKKALQKHGKNSTMKLYVPS
jgi:hypothetical protein